MNAAEKVAREITWGVSVALAAGDPDGADRLVVARLGPLLNACAAYPEDVRDRDAVLDYASKVWRAYSALAGEKP